MKQGHQVCFENLLFFMHLFFTTPAMASFLLIFDSRFFDPVIEMI